MQMQTKPSSARLFGKDAKRAAATAQMDRETAPRSLEDKPETTAAGETRPRERKRFYPKH